nr:uncharacterized protein LOC118050817 isoform X2 [Populus alba]
MFGGGGGGGSVNWGRKESESKGIVVIFAWNSIPEKHLNSYLDLYSSLGWNSLVSHADFLSAFYPERALSLAYILLNELVEDLRVRPCPIVFVAFSGGPKACMYKVFQIIQGTCEGHLNMDESRLVKNCISGHIYDSCPIDFTSDLGARFALHPAIQRMPGPSKFVSLVAKGLASGLDGLYLTRFESQRAEYWQTLYSSIDMGAPYLILCSENDNLAPYNVISKFAQRLQDQGGDVKLVKWNHSPHTDLQIYGLQLDQCCSNHFQWTCSANSVCMLWVSYCLPTMKMRRGAKDKSYTAQIPLVDKLLDYFCCLELSFYLTCNCSICSMSLTC